MPKIFVFVCCWVCLYYQHPDLGLIVIQWLCVCVGIESFVGFVVPSLFLVRTEGMSHGRMNRHATRHCGDRLPFGRRSDVATSSDHFGSWSVSYRFCGLFVVDHNPGCPQNSYTGVLVAYFGRIHAGIFCGDSVGLFGARLCLARRRRQCQNQHLADGCGSCHRRGY